MSQEKISFEDLRKKDYSALRAMKIAASERIMALKLQQSRGEMKDISVFKKLRVQNARVSTLLSQKRSGHAS